MVLTWKHPLVQDWSYFEVCSASSVVLDLRDPSQWESWSVSWFWFGIATISNACSWIFGWDTNFGVDKWWQTVNIKSASGFPDLHKWLRQSLTRKTLNTHLFWQFHHLACPFKSSHWKSNCSRPGTSAGCPTGWTTSFLSYNFNRFGY